MGNPNLENYPRDVTQLLCVCRWVLGKGKKMVMGHWQSLHEETASSPLFSFSCACCNILARGAHGTLAVTPAAKTHIEGCMLCSSQQ